MKRVKTNNPELETDATYQRFIIQVCQGCLESKGEQCHTPGCVCIRLTTPEIQDLLSQLNIRPRCDGKLLFDEILGEVNSQEIRNLVPGDG